MDIILGKRDFLESLRGKSATFLLALSFTKTANIKGITQAGLPGYIYLTPTLDAEMLALKEIRSLFSLAKTKKGVPSPALITRAVHQLKPFKNIEFLNLGLEEKPKIEYFKIYDFCISSSGRIDKDSKIDAKKVFKKGLKFAKKYKLKSDYLILAESTPGGTTTARASVEALGYKTKGLFSSTFKDKPSIKEKVIKKALKRIKKKKSIFKKLSLVSDNMLLFYAGFVFEMSKKTKIVLAGGTQMAALLLIIDAIKKEKKYGLKYENLSLITTKWVYKDKSSNIRKLLNMLSFSINAYASSFDFSKSVHPLLKLYDKGEAKEGVGAGAALVYASINGIKKKKITKEIEKFLI